MRVPVRPKISPSCRIHNQCRQCVTFTDAVTVAVARDILLRVEIPEGVAVFVLCNQLMASVNNAANSIAVAVSNYSFMRHTVYSLFIAIKS